MNNNEKEVYGNIMEQLKLSITVNRIIDYFKNIKYGENVDPAIKQATSKMLFLADPDVDAKGWIEKAFSDFMEKEELEPIRALGKFDPIMILYIVKAYRQLRNRKESITEETVLEEYKKLLGV